MGFQDVQMYSFVSCAACNCDPIGSLSSVCDQSTGVCDCMEGFGGDSCDDCSLDSSGVFPNCQACDECTTQWEDKIFPLEEQIETTIEFIGSLNFTNDTSVGDPGDIPELEILFELVSDIKRVLNTSIIESLSSDVNSTHLFICSLLSETTDLLERAREAENQIESLELVSSSITEQLDILRVMLMQVELEFLNISFTFNQEDFVTVDTSEYLELARIALERSNTADQLIQENVTGLLNQSVDILNTYNSTRMSSNFQSNHVLLVQSLVSIDERVDVFKLFIAESNQVLCGAENSTNVDCDLDCGGVACATCGSGSCNSLYSMSQDALNISQRALSLAEDALVRIQLQVDTLRSLLTDIEQTQRDAAGVEGFVNETRLRAESVLNDLQMLVVQIEQELDRRRVDPDEIGRRENMTLSLQLDLLPDEVYICTNHEKTLSRLCYLILAPYNISVVHQA